MKGRKGERSARERRATVCESRERRKPSWKIPSSLCLETRNSEEQGGKEGEGGTTAGKGERGELQPSFPLAFSPVKELVGRRHEDGGREREKSGKRRGGDVDNAGKT